ncbi:flippase [Candidatus Uhrbacteria bacterium]|jgi:O-antigen/teichoic acid export membrane protein|nr:flippase [Candidatus Uhrbacteria bacterium]
MDSKALAQNTAIQITARALITIIGVVTVGIMTRYLGTTGYGQFTIALSFLSIFAVIVDFGLTLTTTQMISEKLADEKRLLSNLISLRIISGIIFLSLAPLAALLFPYEQVVLIAIAVGAVSYLFGTTSQMFIGVFQKRLVIGRAMVAEIINRLLVLIGIIAAPFFGWGVVGIMWLLVIGNGAQLLIVLLLSRRLIRFGITVEWAFWKKIISRSWPIGASIFFNLIYLRGDIVFLSLFRSDAEVGIYGAAYKVIDVMTSIPVMFMGLLLPMLVAAWTASNKKLFRDTMQRAFDFLSLLALPMILGSIVIGVPLMTLIAGADFAESGEVLAILGPAGALVFWGSLFGHAIVGVNKQRVMTWGYAAVAVLTIAGYIIFIPAHGMWAAAWLTLFSELLIGIVTATVVMRVGGFRPRFGMVLRGLIASIIMAVVLIMLPTQNAIILLPAGILIYGIIIPLIGGPGPRDIIKLLKPENV